MSRKTVISSFLIFFGVCLGLLLQFAYIGSAREAAVYLASMALAVTSIVAGSVLAYSRVLDRFVRPLMDVIYKDIEDDLEDLKARRLTNPIWMVALTAAAGLVFSYFVSRYRMMEANWQGLPAFIPALLGVGLLAWYLPRTRWFRDFHMPTPMWVYFIPLSGLIISLVLGIPMSHQMDRMGTARQDSVQMNTGQGAGQDTNQAAGLINLLRWVELPYCDEDVCGMIVMVILLVVLTFVLVIGSAFIPHFWLVSGSIFLGIMAIIALHDLRLRRQEDDHTHPDRAPSRYTSASSS